MVGAITTLIVVVAVFLAYNANSGLPFVPVYRVSVMVPNAARVTHDNEIKEQLPHAIAVEPQAGGRSDAACATAGIRLAEVS